MVIVGQIMKKIKKISAKSAWFCHFGWGRVFDGVGKGFTFLVDIFTPVSICDKTAGIGENIQTHKRMDGTTYGWTDRRGG